MRKTASVREIYLEKWIQSERDRYGRNTDVRRSVYTKSQGGVAISGIFIAACFSWAKDIVEGGVLISSMEKYGIFCALICFSVSVIFSLRVLVVRRIPSPDERKLIIPLLDLDDGEIGERLIPYLHDMRKYWEKVNVELDTLLRGQGHMLLFSQSFLSIGVLVMSFVSVSFILCH